MYTGLSTETVNLTPSNVTDPNTMRAVALRHARILNERNDRQGAALLLQSYGLKLADLPGVEHVSDTSLPGENILSHEAALQIKSKRILAAGLGALLEP
jgi:hypothetical protein